MATDYQVWSSLTPEEPIDPELPICDPHHHMWDRPNQTYLLKELIRYTGAGHNVVKMVFIAAGFLRRLVRKWDGPQEMQVVGETEFTQGIIDQSIDSPANFAAGIVGFADLTAGSTVVSTVLEAHITASKNRLRGVRHATNWDVNANVPSFCRTPMLLLDPKFREGFACLQKYNLSFDSLLYYTQLMELADLARAFPDTQIIINHTGAPLGIGPYADRRDEIFQAWKRAIAAVAICPNVVVKLGGLGIEPCGFNWHDAVPTPSSADLAKVIAPYCYWCIEKFGVDRCMFESNFPDDNISFSYSLSWNAYKQITASFSESERSALFHDTAARVYRL